MNYAENSSSEEDYEEGLVFDSPLRSPVNPLTSPQRPVVSREASPQPLAHPTLADNVDDILEEVQYKLHDIAVVREEIEEVTDLLETADTKVGEDQKASDEVEVVVEESGYIVGQAQTETCQGPPDNSEDGEDSEDEDAEMVVNFDVEDKEDGEKSADQARSIKIEFDATDIRFWFSQLEDEMEIASVGRQWLKKTVLQRNLPVKQKEDVKSLLTLQKAEAGDRIYHRIKSELIRIYAPKPQDSYRKALERTMTGLPSQVGYQIINDICKKANKLDGCCCAGAALAIWSMKLPVGVLAHISNMEFTKDTFKEVFEAADKVHQSSQQLQVAAVNLDETQSAFNPQNQPQVAAFTNRGQRPARGGGSGSGAGGQSNRGNGRGGGRGKRGGRGGASQASRGPRHSSNPPEQCCERHYRHGPEAWYCVAPLTCPWVSKCTARP